MPSTRRMLLLVGHPGSGKTTFSQALLEMDPSWARVSQDDLGSRPACERAAVTYAEQGKHVIIDRCNFDQDQRRRWVQLANQYPQLFDRIDCLYLSTPTDKCAERIMARHNHPTEVTGEKGVRILYRFEKNFRPPTLDEGFHTLHITEPLYLDDAAFHSDAGKVLIQEFVRAQISKFLQ